MSLIPKKNGVFHISSIPRAAEYKDGARVYRGHGSDTSQNTDNIIYIMSVPLERTVTFKAFIENLKINLTKEIEKKEEKDKDTTLVRQYAGQVSYEVTLNIPAHSVNEAANNVAKLEELQKLIAPLDSSATDGIYDFLVDGATTAMPIFKVYMKNLISNGANSLFAWSPNAEQIGALGLPCFIESIKYEPDQESGYFEFQNYLYPKNLKLNLTLNLDQNTLLLEDKVIMAFAEDGNYIDEDLGGFPFGVPVTFDEALLKPFDNEEENMIQLRAEYNNKTLNKLDYAGARQDTYIYISNGSDAEKNIKRWVLFKPFIESFSRDHKTDLIRNESKDLDVNGGLMAGSNVSFGHLRYEMKISLPARNVQEAKKNCGKLSYLSRMFYKKTNDPTTVDDGSIPQRVVYVYIPTMIEKPGAQKTKPKNTDHKQMQGNAIPLYFESLSFDINMEMGFFEEGGNLYPKELSIDFAFFYNKGDLINNYTYDIIDDKYRHRSSVDYKDKEHLFPFNKKTIILGE